MSGFKVVSDFDPKGDQPQAIEKIAKNLNDGLLNQTLLGVTGSGKTYTIAKVIEETQRPAIIMAPIRHWQHNCMESSKIFSQKTGWNTSFLTMTITSLKHMYHLQILI